MHIHDVLGMKIQDYELERGRIEKLFQYRKIPIRTSLGLIQYQTYKQFAEDAFIKSPFRGTAVDISDYMNSLRGYWASPSLKGLLFYVEVIFNIVMEMQESIRTYSNAVSIVHNQLRENIKIILDKTGYEILQADDGIFFVSQKNSLASDVVYGLNAKDKDLAFSILEYNRFLLEGDIDRKRELLNTIGRAVEPILNDTSKKCWCPDVFDDVRFALNCLNIRHNNEQGKNAKEALVKLTPKKLEFAYDHLYASMLILLKISQGQVGHILMCELKEQMKQNNTVSK